MSTQLKSVIRQTHRAANQPEFDDQLSLGGRVIFLGGIVILGAGWMWLFFRVLAS